MVNELDSFRLTFSLLCQELLFNRVVNVIEVLLMDHGAGL